MFRKVHLYLTALCAGITTAILIVMSLLYLYLSEKELYETQYRSFQNDVNTIATSLEQQSVISMEWLSKLESRSGYIFYALDNGVPFLYNRLTGRSDSSDTINLLSSCLSVYQTSVEYTYIQEELNNGGLYNTCFHAEFPFNPAGGKHEYYASVIELQKNAASLQIVILSPLQFLQEQIIRQRIRFLLIDMAAIFLLTVFSFIFTGRLLQPVIESRKKQAAFVAAASHELRTPLAVILSAAECCRDAERDNRIKFLDTVRQEGELMASLINDMLTLSASDSHNFSVSLSPVELDTLLINASEAFEPLAAKKSNPFPSLFRKTGFLPAWPMRNASCSFSPSCCTTPSATRRKAVPSNCPLPAKRTVSISPSRTPAPAFYRKIEKRFLTVFTGRKNPEAPKGTSGSGCLSPRKL